MTVGCFFFLFIYFCGVGLELGDECHLTYQFSAVPREAWAQETQFPISQVKGRSSDAIFTKEIEMFRLLGSPE